MPGAAQSDSDHALYQLAEYGPLRWQVSHAQGARPAAGGQQHLVERGQAQVSWFLAPYLSFVAASPPNCFYSCSQLVHDLTLGPRRSGCNSSWTGLYAWHPFPVTPYCRSRNEEGGILDRQQALIHRQVEIQLDLLPGVAHECEAEAVGARILQTRELRLK